MITLFDLLIVAAIVALAYRGWLVGLEAASVAALELLACLSIAVMLHEAVAGVLHAAFVMLLGDGVGQSWSILLAFGMLAWGAFALIRMLCHRPPSEDDPDTDIDPLGDRLGGAVAGCFGGVIFVGGVLVTLSMVPFLAGFKPSGDRMLLDVGKTVLRAACQFAVEPEGRRSLPLWGEPASRMTQPDARLTSEPWFDADDNGGFTDADRYRDVDGSGTFTKDLYFEDIDGDGFRRVGMIDKYVAGRWDSSLISNDRPRPDLKKPTPPKPASPKPTPPQPASSKPTPPQPAPPKPTPAQPTPAAPRPSVPPGSDGPASAPPANPTAGEKTPTSAPAEGAEKADKPKTEKGKPADAGKKPAPPPVGKQADDDF